MRHDLARQHAKPAPGESIDAFIAAKLQTAGTEPAPLTDDAAFFRRMTLDTLGTIPTAEETAAFLADTAPDKRTHAIERRLADPRFP